MKTVVFEFTDPAPGDLVIVQYRAARGGRTHVMHRMGKDDTAKTLARALSESINKEWLPDCFQAKVNDAGAMIVNCADPVSDVAFSYDIEGGGGTGVKMTEF